MMVHVIAAAVGGCLGGVAAVFAALAWLAVNEDRVPEEKEVQE